MLKATRSLTPEWYTPQSEQDAAQPTRFLIRPLSGAEQLDVRYTKDVHGNHLLTEAGARAALRRGLMGWENFLDEKDRPLQFLHGDPDWNINQLPLAIVVELSTEIYVRSILTEDQRKNLSSPPTSPATAKSSDAAVAAGGGTATSETQPVSQNGA